ncbi:MULTISPECIES: rhomboid family intramembrane serine protease [unclassified Mucilaginibacter]|uniref:rhomboid family intramembrane serine protease n=1 Tax=unclassified Mucilaginibacter TaxID=2617802 RepID=UPI002AC91738|nr:MULTISPECIES: rhomboid family intramembrane serine protease [unclassified Mucilaginibacter]MEB0261636.1 rhomboid family intramembrane serine protease [Mucilaginibacter sp. 10I4]MEB0278501.1 rhomboid family intramembrane serine protease [Mucilaginibacter sp. 10B2]MEB0300721.1 rhomboid family intramembrane serine protease [Mucilaginibacter sp. 5C4]WPX23543.1 rhomboid family intramembrane serine protease [Mucilaginibacter sp. 5C4]
MSTIWKDFQYKMLKSDSRITLLIGINIVVFLLANIPFTSILTNKYLLLFPNLPELLRHFWTPLSYMFMNEGFFPTLFNMLWLYWMGRVFEEYLNHKRLMGLYIIGGLVGATLYIATYNILNAFNITLPAIGITGASVSIMSIMVATATLLPNYELQLIIIGRVKLKWVCIVYVALALIGARNNPGTQIAQVGGALIGFIFIKQLNSGYDWIKSINSLFMPKPKMKVVSYREPQRKVSTAPQEEDIDRILDKITATGYKSLTKLEKETLDNLSK